MYLSVVHFFTKLYCIKRLGMYVCTARLLQLSCLYVCVYLSVVISLLCLFCHNEHFHVRFSQIWSHHTNFTYVSDFVNITILDQKFCRGTCWHIGYPKVQKIKAVIQYLNTCTYRGRPACSHYTKFKLISNRFKTEFGPMCIQ